MDFKQEGHIGLMAEYPLKLRKWYEDVLDFKVIYKLPATEQRMGVYWLQRGNNVIEIVPANKKERITRERKDPGLSHFSITVDDFDRFVDALKKKNIIVNDIHEFNAFRCGFFEDLEGNLIELISFY